MDIPPEHTVECTSKLLTATINTQQLATAPQVLQ